MFNEYRYTEFAVGIADRGRIYDISHIKKLHAENFENDCYINTLFFDRKFLGYVKNRGTVAGFHGVAYMPYFPIDIDSLELDDSLKIANGLLEQLSLSGVPVNKLKLFFSGKKGFHIMIPNKMIGAEPSENISGIMKNFSGLLLSGIKFDQTIYNHVRLFRLPNTRHKSGLFKIPLSYQEFLTSTPESIRELAKTQRNVEVKYEGDVIPYLKGLWEEAKTKTTKLYDIKYKEENESSEYKFPCYRNLFEQGAGEGYRNQAALRVAWILKKTGANFNIIMNALKEWNVTKNIPPLPESEIETVARQAWKGNYQFGCSDSILSMYCSEECFLHKKRQENETMSDFLDISQIAHEYFEFVDSFKRNNVRFFNPIDSYIRGLLPGFVTFLMARAGVGKTSFLIDTIYRMSEHKIPIIFFSLEMPKTMIFERLASRFFKFERNEIQGFNSRGDSKAQILRMQEYFEKLMIIDRPGLSVEQMEQYLEIASDRIFGERVKVVMVDYFGLIKEPTNGVYEKATKIADKLQNFAKSKQVSIFSLLQTNRSGGEDGTKRLTMASGRDSGHIEEIADLVLTMWRNADNGQEDIFLEIVKNRYGESGIGFKCEADRGRNIWNLIPFPKLTIKAGGTDREKSTG